ncbi:Uncharacterised protein [Moraxella lacunata]|uniref:Uncharacterized protein n=1 Tax=Moraxella lacunata TaxID=477 RepID=A0A378T5U5_MORLA|nr:hypothetical protein [Moraxella lacunata]STZ55537.1 Uncharacterised protein [Moraxella lacunata]
MSDLQKRPYLLIADRNSQEHQDILKILNENQFLISSPPNSYSISFDMAVFMIHGHNKRVFVRFVDFENFGLWRGCIYNIITFKVFKGIFEKPTTRMATLTIPHDNS